MGEARFVSSAGRGRVDCIMLTSSNLALLFSVSPLYTSVSSSLMIAITLLKALVSQACLCMSMSSANR